MNRPLAPRPTLSGRLTAAFLPLIPVLVLAILVYTAWAWSGLRPSFHRIAVFLAAFLALALFAPHPNLPRRILRLRDPVFPLGLALIALLAIQWFNAGRELILDPALNQWVYTDPPHPRLPFAFTRPEAWQIITWFFPAWILLLAVRSSAFSPPSALTLLQILAVSSGLLSLFGLVQWFSGTREVYWTVPFSASFFASFIYRNHAASYFALASCLSAGLLFRHLFPSPPRPPQPLLAITLALSLLLCLLGLMFCGSRAGLFFAMFLGPALAISLWLRLWPGASPARKFHMLSILLAVIGLTSLLFFTYDPAKLSPRLTPLAVDRITRNLERTGELNLSLSPEVRIAQAKAAWAIWTQHPWFGVGGWGFRYLFAFQIPEEQWSMVTRSGRANVHMDLLQFLAEFGIVGLSLILTLAAILFRDALRARTPRDPLFPFLTLGLSLVLIHSLIDLPLRNPAILYSWLVVLAIYPALNESSSPAGSPPEGQDPKGIL